MRCQYSFYLLNFHFTLFFLFIIVGSENLLRMNIENHTYSNNHSYMIKNYYCFHFINLDIPIFFMIIEHLNSQIFFILILKFCEYFLLFTLISAWSPLLPVQILLINFDYYLNLSIKSPSYSTLMPPNANLDLYSNRLVFQRFNLHINL